MRIIRWIVASAVVVASFFATWGLCRMVSPGLRLEVVLSLAGLASAVVCVPMGVWASHEELPPRGGQRAALQEPGSGMRAQVVVGEIPRQPPAFQPRAVLRAQLRAGAHGIAVVTAVTGSRGTGKTQLAATFARSCIAAGWPVVGWIVADDAAQALSGMDRLARALGLAGQRDDSATAARKARQWLETQASARSLVVFDNASDAAVVRPWLPAAGQARIIITTTNRACEDLGTAIQVDAFTRAEAVAFLHERTGLADDTGAQALAAEVGCLPLALGQAAAVLRTQHITYETVLERIQTMPLDRLLIRNSGDPYPQGAAQAVLLAVQSAQDADPLARPLASLISVLSPAGTRRDLLYGYVGLDELSGEVTSADVDMTIGRLAEASLLTFSLDGNAVLMHRFTQRVLRDREQHAATLQEWMLIAARLIEARLPDREARWGKRVVCKHLIMQTDVLWSLTAPEVSRGVVSNTTREILRLRGWSNHCLWSIGDTNDVVERGPNVVADHERLLGDDCEDTIKALYGLALAYGDLGRHDEAIQLNQRIVNWYVANRGMDDPSTLNLRNTLANNYTESGRDFAVPARLASTIQRRR